MSEQRIAWLCPNCKALLAWSLTGDQPQAGGAIKCVECDKRSPAQLWLRGTWYSDE